MDGILVERKRKKALARSPVHGNICAEWKYGGSLGSMLALEDGLPVARTFS